MFPPSFLPNLVYTPPIYLSNPKPIIYEASRNTHTSVSPILGIEFLELPGIEVIKKTVSIGEGTSGRKTIIAVGSK